MDQNPPRIDMPRTLGIDIGGSHLKAAVLDPGGKLQTDRVRTPTPQPATPDAVCDALQQLAEGLHPFDRISVGFPGVVRHGIILTAPNLSNQAWAGFALATRLRHILGKPVRILNDAEVAGLSVISGRGLEVLITLGTGMGFAVFQDGVVGPHLEVSHIPVRHGKTYDEYVGQRALEKVGRKHWSKRVRRVIGYISTLTMFDTLYIGGGNAKRLGIDVPPDVRLVTNDAGILGSVKLWDPAMDRVFEPA
jgi:polyphosphate glucokinase